jgi:membrane-associated phospholipid phosphatase
VDELRHADSTADASTSRRPSWRVLVFAALLVAYVVVTLGVIFRSPILDLDNAIYQLHLRRHWHGWYHRVEIYVMLGQRAPSTLVALPWLAWRAWRARSPRPLVLLATALLVLNLTVGVVKVITGRIGPLFTHNVHDVFAGGNIYPSGHVSNTVVLYGVLAMVAVKHRRFAIVAGSFITITVGLCTLYLNTHWFSDVVGGWLAGGLVLVSLPWLMPYAERITDAVIDRIRRVRSRKRVEAPVPQTAPSPEPVPDEALPVDDAPRPGGGSPGRSRIPVLSGRNGRRTTIDAR